MFILFIVLYFVLYIFLLTSIITFIIINRLLILFFSIAKSGQNQIFFKDYRNRLLYLYIYI